MEVVVSVDVPGQHRVPAPVKPLAGRLIEVGRWPDRRNSPPIHPNNLGTRFTPFPGAVDQAPAADQSHRRRVTLHCFHHAYPLSTPAHLALQRTPLPWR